MTTKNKKETPFRAESLLKEVLLKIREEQEEHERLRTVVRRQEAVISTLLAQLSGAAMPAKGEPKKVASPKKPVKPSPVISKKPVKPAQLETILRKKGRPTKEEQELIAAAGIKRRKRIRPNPTGRKPGRPKKEEEAQIAKVKQAFLKKAASGKKPEAALTQPSKEVVVVMRRPREKELPEVKRSGASVAADRRTGVVSREDIEKQFKEIFQNSPLS